LIPITIVEIVGRAEQGMTLPFRCRGEDDYLYYVKGRNADRKSLIAELICGELARAFGLPVAPYEIVDVPEILIESVDPEWKVLGSGLAFGSRAFHHVLEVTWPQVEKTPKQLRQDILVFDWWIRNDDRNFTALGGNPNLLWDGERDSLVVIDHNNAFSPDFSEAEFIQSHIFSSEWDGIVGDVVTRAEYATRLEAAFAVFQQACDNCPPEWFWVDDGVPAQFSLEDVSSILQRFNDQLFWGGAQ
jgi:hypothetical protein